MISQEDFEKVQYLIAVRGSLETIIHELYYMNDISKRKHKHEILEALNAMMRIRDENIEELGKLVDLRKSFTDKHNRAYPKEIFE